MGKQYVITSKQIKELKKCLKSLEKQIKQVTEAEDGNIRTEDTDEHVMVFALFSTTYMKTILNEIEEQ